MITLPISMPRFKSIIYQNSPKVILFLQKNAEAFAPSPPLA